MSQPQIEAKIQCNLDDNDNPYYVLIPSVETQSEEIVIENRDFVDSFDLRWDEGQTQKLLISLDLPIESATAVNVLALSELTSDRG